MFTYFQCMYICMSVYVNCMCMCVCVYVYVYVCVCVVYACWVGLLQQIYVTSISVFYSLCDKRIVMLLPQGLEESWSKHKKNAELLWEGLEKLGLELLVKDKVGITQQRCHYLGPASNVLHPPPPSPPALRLHVCPPSRPSRCQLELT